MEVTPQIDARKARSEKTKARLEGKGIPFIQNI